MFTIRKEQMEAFELASAPRFAEAAKDHLKAALPKHCAQLGDTGVGETVDYGIRKAAAYGVITQAGASLFLDLMLLLGRGFDTDFQLPWAAEILTDAALPDEQTRISLLHTTAMEYLDKVSGPDNEFIDEAQRRIGLESAEWVSKTEPFEVYMLTRLRIIFPQKCDCLGDEILKKLVGKAISKARQYELKTERGVMVLAGLLLMLGSSFDQDPVFASITQVLQNRSIADQQARSKLLHEASLEYLKRWCG